MDEIFESMSCATACALESMSLHAWARWSLSQSTSPTPQTSATLMNQQEVPEEGLDDRRADDLGLLMRAALRGTVEAPVTKGPLERRECRG